jgi:hypothetical protein
MASANLQRQTMAKLLRFESNSCSTRNAAVKATFAATETNAGRVLNPGVDFWQSHNIVTFVEDLYFLIRTLLII